MFHLFQIFILGQVDAIECFLSIKEIADVGFNHGAYKVPVGCQTFAVKRYTLAFAESYHPLDSIVAHCKVVEKVVESGVLSQPFGGMQANLFKSGAVEEPFGGEFVVVDECVVLVVGDKLVREDAATTIDYTTTHGKVGRFILKQIFTTKIMTMV